MQKMYYDFQKSYRSLPLFVWRRKIHTRTSKQNDTNKFLHQSRVKLASRALQMNKRNAAIWVAQIVNSQIDKAKMPKLKIRLFCNKICLLR